MRPSVLVCLFVWYVNGEDGVDPRAPAELWLRVVSLAALRWWSVLRWGLGGGALMRKPRPLRHCWS